MQGIKPLLLAAMIGATALPAAATAKPPLGEVKAVHDGLLAVGIADEIRKSCGNIGARMIAAYSFLGDLKGKARALKVYNVVGPKDPSSMWDERTRPV